MRSDRHIVTRVCMLVSVCFVVSSCQRGQVAERDSGAAKVQRLRQEYEKFDRAVSYLLAVNAEAMRQNPDLHFVERGLHRVNEMKRAGLPGEREFKQYRASRANAEQFERTYMRCRHAFGTKAWAEAIRDPDREPELRPVMILNYRYLLPRSSANWREKFIDALKSRGLTVFEPNDPNDERLWRNIKRNMFEMAEYTTGERAKLVGEGVPEFMRRYAGQYEVMNACSELYWYWMKAHVPKELVEAAKALDEQEQKLSAIEPEWAKDLERFGRDPQTEHKRLYIADSLRNMLHDHFSTLQDGRFETGDSDAGT
ncbi:MAG TPA: hypothetical protein VMX13_14370 [Sedimentisphaerales bacterium]|nr:hypothetical protein [Sedimentisphaerales bacterium]